MKKSDMVRGMSFATEFLTELYKEVINLGGTEEVMFEKMKNGGLAKEFAKLIVTGANNAKNILRILSNLSFKDRITHGKYDWVNSDITEEHFPTIISADYDAEYKLFHFNRNISSSDNMIKEMDKDEYRPGTLAELLVLGETQLELQKQFPIIALGSVWQDSAGNRNVPALY